jgi:hypothetical protein
MVKTLDFFHKGYGQEILIDLEKGVVENSSFIYDKRDHN